MSYCTEFDVRSMVKDDAVKILVGDPYDISDEELEDKFSAIIVAAMADADSEIDGYLAKRYPLPFANPPSILNKLSKDIAIYNVFSRADSETVKQYAERYKNAVRLLENVAKGVVNLGTDGLNKNSTAVPSAAGVKFKSGGKLFSRDTLKGM